jgi:hypothetical protein
LHVTVNYLLLKGKFHFPLKISSNQAASLLTPVL